MNTNGFSSCLKRICSRDSTYRVRFALPAEGVWDYSITCSDTDNTRLHGVRGQVYARKYNGPNPFCAKGWLKVSSNGRYLTYGDAEPFFYLGDTAWELTWKSREPEVLAYLADRKRKGFNALQIVVMSHQFFYENGAGNRYGADFFLNDDRSRPNPRYIELSLRRLWIQRSSVWYNRKPKVFFWPNQSRIFSTTSRDHRP
jgi:hypothetical protein